MTDRLTYDDIVEQGGPWPFAVNGQPFRSHAEARIYVNGWNAAVDHLTGKAS